MNPMEPNTKMFALTIRVSPTEYDLWLLLKDSNLEKLRNNYPLDFQPSQCEEPIRSMKMRAVVLCYANEGDYQTVWKLLQAGKMLEAVRYLSRGWRFGTEAEEDKPYATVLQGGINQRGTETRSEQE